MGNFLTKLKSIKGLWLLIIGLLAGLALIVIGNSGFLDKKTPSPPAETKSDSKQLTEYVFTLESQISGLLEKMDGVSGVSVMVTLDSGSETVYAQDGTYSGGILTAREYVIIEDGKPITVKVITPKLRGIAVVCNGGSNPIVQEKIISLLCALFDLSSNHVYVTG